MRAIFYILVLFICTIGTADLETQTPRERKQIKVKHLITKHNHRNKSISITKQESKTALAFIFSTTSKPSSSNKSHALSKGEIRKRQKYLRRERAKLRSILKVKRAHHSSTPEVSNIFAKITEINEELRKYGSPYGKKRGRIKKPKKQFNKTTTENANILELTTAQNKNYVFKWRMKNDTSLENIIKKLNKDPEQNFGGDSFKTQSDGAFPAAVEKFRSESFIKGDILLPMISIEDNNKTNTGATNSSTPKNESIITREIESITNDSSKSGFKDHNLEKGHANINYANLMMIQSTTIPPVKNLSLDTIFNEFNAMSDQVNDVIPNIVDKYSKINRTREMTFKRRINRCSVRKGGCEHICRPKGARKCVCMPGFKLSSNMRSCIDINECTQSNGGCKDICKNTPGSYYCACSIGLRLSDDKESCEDIDECLLRNGHGPCQDTCTNSYGSYECSCSALIGTSLSNDKHSCEDINECADNRIGCSHNCVNTLGRAYCTCPDGMMLTEDWKTCADIDECEDEDIQKQCKHGCLNLIGSYRCVDFFELQSDQSVISVPDHIACPPLFPPKHGFLDCSRERGVEIKVKTKNGRRRITNRPGTFCRLICPDGYAKIGKYDVTCGFNGDWLGEKLGKCESTKY